MKKISLILFLTLPFILTGCYNYQELNDMALTAAIGIDKSENGYTFTAQVVNTKNSKDNSTPSSAITIYTAEGKTIQEAARLILLESPKKLFIQHLDILIISEEVAQEGIENILDVFFRTVRSRNQFDVLIARDYSSKDILSVITPLETISSSNIKDSLKADNNFLGTTSMVTMEDMLKTYLNDKMEVSIPSITLKGDIENGDKTENIEESNSETKVSLSNTAIFKKDKLIGYLDNFDEDIAANIIMGHINHTLLTYKCDDKNYTTIEVFGMKSSVNADKKKLKIEINVEGTASINEINCKVDLEKNETINLLQDKTNDYLVSNLKHTIDKIKNTFDSDIFGFEDLIYKNNNKLYKEIKDTWKEKFKDLDIDIKSNIKIIEKGQVIKVIEHE